MREKVKLELERLHEHDIIEPVKFSGWTAPIVPVNQMVVSEFVVTTS